MIKNSHCKRFTDCNACLKASRGIFTFNQFNQGQHFPADKCTQNCILFLLKGELLINSQEYPGTTLREGDFILQAIGSKIEILALPDVEYIQYWFNELPAICQTRHDEIMDNAEEPNYYVPLVVSQQLDTFLTCLKEYLLEGMPCGLFIEMKAKELIFLLTGYYPLAQISTFFFPISTYTESFHYFVMSNYKLVKNVEEFAHRGGYNVTTFRRLFRNMYGVPVYEWILNKKREGIFDDLVNTKERINEISARYGFDSASHFAQERKSGAKGKSGGLG